MTQLCAQLIYHKPHDILMIILRFLKRIANQMDNPETQATLSPRDRTSGSSLGSIGVKAISIFPIKNEFMAIISNTFGSMILKSQ